MFLDAPDRSLSHRARLAAFAAALALLGGCATATRQDGTANTALYEAAIKSPVRTERDRTMDATRKPTEFLPFTQVQPGMQVLDLVTGAGYTSQLMALVVGPGGKVWAQTPKAGAALNERLKAHPQANLVVVERPFGDPVPPEAPKLDLITYINNFHDISYLPVDRPEMHRRLYDALKPGGRLVIMDHSAVAGSGITAGKTLHRIEEAVVLEEIIKAGFVLDAQGSFLRNSADTRLESSNKGTSDKFVLRFVRPK